MFRVGERTVRTTQQLPKTGPAALVDRWRADADRFDVLGQTAAAAQSRAYANELERALTEHDLEQLTISQAAAESGYDASSLRRMFPKERRGKRTIARKDLPRKARRGGPDLAGAVLQGRKP
jgi:hypothetical protein